MMRHLLRLGYKVGRRRIRSLMRKMGIEAIYQKPRTTKSEPAHKKYPYLLKGLEITKPNQVWCADITYIRIKRGFMYMIAVMDWYSRKVLSWRLSNTMNVDFCIDAVEEAIKNFGKPEIFNTDQGSQFTSEKFISVLKKNGIRISMDGKGRWMDNVFIERLWRSMKYECVYLNALESGIQARRDIARWINFYNCERPHSTFDGATPDEIYGQNSYQFNRWENSGKKNIIEIDIDIGNKKCDISPQYEHAHIEVTKKVA
jgi:putative transposase